MRANRSDSSGGGTLSVSAKRSSKWSKSSPGPGAKYTLANPRLHLDSHQSGSHAGLQHLTCDLLEQGICIGYLDVHLHHNTRGLSVGSTLCVFNGAKDRVE